MLMGLWMTFGIQQTTQNDMKNVTDGDGELFRARPLVGSKQRP